MDDFIKVGIGILTTILIPLTLYGGFVAIRVFQRRSEGQAMPPDLPGEMAELRARVAQLEQVQGRVEELEERMDFSERLLTREKQPGQFKT